MSNPKKSKKNGVRTLAESTGLSIATVSRVLNNSPLVSEKSRALVLEHMQKTGYVPNSAARALATNRTKIIGAVIPTVDHSIFSRFIHAIESELSESGYALVLAITGFDQDNELRRANELIHMGAEGLILSGAVHKPELLELIKAAGVPVLFSSVHESLDKDIPAIGYDNQQLAYSATEYLASHHHKHLAVIHGPEGQSDRTALRIKGVRQYAETFGLTVDYIEQELSVAGGVIGAKEVFTQEALPDAIMCTSDIMALGVMFEASRAGVVIPQDMSLMGFDNLDWAELSNPPLTTIRLPSWQMGVSVARAMVEFLEEGRPISSLTLHGRLCERGTVQVRGEKNKI